MTDWTKIEDALPPRNKILMVKTADGKEKESFLFPDIHEGGRYFVDCEFEGFAELENVTHWREK